MILYPAIDLKDGQCVRLLRGEMEAATVFGDDPAAQALTFQTAGCDWLHLVDLNGAFAGQPDVLPDPVGPISRMLLLASSTSSFFAFSLWRRRL